MSAPALEDRAAMPTMVSRLPKFGSRFPKSSTLSSGAAAPMGQTATGAAQSSGTRLTNGFYHHPGPAAAGCNAKTTAAAAPVKHNNFIRAPTAISVKWRKENEAVEVEEGGERLKGKGKFGSYCSQAQPGSQVRKTGAPSPEKGRGGGGFGFSVTSSSSSPPSSSSSSSHSLSVQPSPRTLPVSKSGSQGSKAILSTFSGSKLRSGSLRQPQSFGPGPGSPGPGLGSLGLGSGPGSRSGSPLQLQKTKKKKKPPASRSQSSDSLISTGPDVPLTESDRFRSRSLTQVRRQPSPTLPPSSSPSSSSVSRIRTSLARPVPEAPGLKVKSSGLPSALKKPLLPPSLGLGLACKPSGLSYRLSRPSLIKQPRPLRVTSANETAGEREASQCRAARRNSVETPSTTENSPESTPEAPEPEGLSAAQASQGDVSIVGETLEDMSLSSNSSLDRNDTSQEYMDDFDNLGNGGVGILLLSSKNEEDDSGLDQSCARFDEDKVAVNGVAKPTGLCFLDDGMDWADMRLGGEGGEHRLTTLSHRRHPSQPEYHEQGGSSLDLSPSDSCGSGGTYMWDEEGLEPLGGGPTTASIHSNANTSHHIGSFDSDLNSIDVLNNLDSCDLDDDDLMLDADLPEDASLHSDGDGIAHMAQWRMRQLCWGTQDIHSENESDFQCFKLTEDPGNKRTDTTGDSGLILDLCPPRSPCLSPGTPGLGLDVEEMAEDCSAVRSQLEYLQRILLQEEDGDEDTLTTDTLLSPDNESSHSSDTQVQALLQEVQQLREELRSRDQTITQLTLQLSVPMVTTRCGCQEGRMDRHTQTSVTERESVASQTPWREHTAFPPVPFLSPPWQYQRSRPYRVRPKPSIPSHLARKITDMSLLQPERPGTTEAPKPRSADPSHQEIPAAPTAL
ncbi:serine-rich coiled-coil domain-containing protein 2 isoform X2 [Perca flavescens]|uniref:serine-rich coiled-coil domain-containing protein 2 isoform X2 n=1 Tax=Perca flavescens TaxID=8167 RepID=UPI00106E6B69|nr:serine-rich coiled-coil domain-containing protein 2-like isoform X2 [Perca flavescens]